MPSREGEHAEGVPAAEVGAAADDRAEGGVDLAVAAPPAAETLAPQEEEDVEEEEDVRR